MLREIEDEPLGSHFNYISFIGMKNGFILAIVLYVKEKRLLLHWSSLQ
jgi:hypothetical protein